MHTLKSLALLVMLALLSGCSSLGEKWGVKPWQRNELARQAMQPSPDYFDNFFDEHIYFSKEASTGGQGIGGGGCGCN